MSREDALDLHEDRKLRSKHDRWVNDFQDVRKLT